MEKQRTQEWFNARRYRFTGSRIHEIMGTKISMAYVKEVVLEALDPYLEESYVSPDMERGNILEETAFKKLTEILNKRFIQTETCGFFPYENFSGASPDGLTSDNGVIEIKCPRAKTFFEVVETGKIDPKYYDQMQCEMLATGRSKAYYFNYFVNMNGKEYWHLIEVPRDEVRINFMKERIKQAADMAKIYEMTIKKNKQF